MRLAAKTGLGDGVGWVNYLFWLRTLVTGQVRLVPELGCVLDKLDIALVLL